MNLKSKSVFAFLFASLFSTITLIAQSSNPDSTGFLGDHFSLEGALSLFEEAQSLEAFEKELNTEKEYVNNLDLNEDGEIDYIRVIDNMEDDFHAIVLQAVFSENESQDIAVIEIEKDGNESATLQIIGDEDVYGVQKIVEPFDVTVEQNGNGPSADSKMTRVIINVWGWPSVRFIYRPAYRPYVSPWRWRTYPSYWKPWRPYTLRIHRSHRVFKPHFRVVKTHRVLRAHRVYTPVRRTSKVVRTRTTVVRKRNGNVVVRKNKVVRNKKRNTVKRKNVRKARRKRG